MTITQRGAADLRSLRQFNADLSGHPRYRGGLLILFEIPISTCRGFRTQSSSRLPSTSSSATGMCRRGPSRSSHPTRRPTHASARLLLISADPGHAAASSPRVRLPLPGFGNSGTRAPRTATARRPVLRKRPTRRRSPTETEEREAGDLRLRGAVEKVDRRAVLAGQHRGAVSDAPGEELVVLGGRSRPSATSGTFRPRSSSRV